MKVTRRGFGIIEFEDRNEQDCSLQQSSAICDDRKESWNNPGSSGIWLGVDGYRMHLNRTMVEKIVEHLIAWLQTGSFELFPSGDDPNIPRGPDCGPEVLAEYFRKSGK